MDRETRCSDPTTIKCGATQAQNDRKNTNLFLDKHFGGTIIADEALPENNGHPVPSAVRTGLRSRLGQARLQGTALAE